MDFFEWIKYCEKQTVFRKGAVTEAWPGLMAIWLGQKGMGELEVSVWGHSLEGR